MSAAIEGKVAQILSENLIIINVGAEAGVKLGMCFAVLAQGEEVADPESGAVLGRWEIPKGHLRVTHVQERLATCEGDMPAAAVKGDDSSANVLSAAMITHSMQPSSWQSRSKVQLDVNRSQMAGMPSIGPISVGDLVREVPAEQIAKPLPEAAPETDAEPGAPPGQEKTS